MDARYETISDAFIARVPPGTKVSSVQGEVFDIDEETWEEYAVFGGGRCGILLSYEIERSLYMPDYFTGEPMESSFTPHMVVQPFDFVETLEFYNPTDLEYFIGGAWLTFDEVMALEA